MDRQVLINLVEKKPISSNTNSRLISNLKFFDDKIDKNEIKPSEVYESIGKLQIVNITLDRNIDDAQAIFESLNSTGKELTESDLIRNYVLMGLEPQEQTFVYENQWRPMELLFDYDKQEIVMDRFFRDYLTMKQTRIPKQNCVYEEFKNYHLNCGFETIRELCDDLFSHAKLYTDMVFNRSNNTKLKRLYSDINDLRMEVSYPFLLKVHIDHAAGLITDENLEEILEICVNYVLRRSICEIPTNSLNKTFAIFKNSINIDDYMNSVKANFILLENYKRFPTDEEFSAAFVSKDIYNMRQRNFILSHLENFDNKAPINISNFTVEHIMPQNPKLSDEWKSDLGINWKDIQKKYLHTIGNLTLTAYNSEMSDRPFMDKMDMEGGFKESALRLNKYIVVQDKWDEIKINERAEQLADKAKKIWSYPNITEGDLEDYQVVEKSEVTYSIDTYELNNITKMLFNMLDKQILNLSPNVKREYKKIYIAYKLDTKFVDIMFQKKRLVVSVNMKHADMNDANGIRMNITQLGKLDDGYAELYVEDTSDIEKVMNIIKKSYKFYQD